jgi:hypothetical protein
MANMKLADVAEISDEHTLASFLLFLTLFFLYICSAKIKKNYVHSGVQLESAIIIDRS